MRKLWRYGEAIEKLGIDDEISNYEKKIIMAKFYYLVKDK